MATAFIVARVAIFLEPGERWQATNPQGEGISDDHGDPWMVNSITLSHAEGEYVSVTVCNSTGQESDLGPKKVTLLPAHIQPLVRSARLSLQAIRGIEAVTADGVAR